MVEMVLIVVVEGSLVVVSSLVVVLLVSEGVALDMILDGSCPSVNDESMSRVGSQGRGRRSKMNPPLLFCAVRSK